MFSITSVLKKTCLSISLLSLFLQTSASQSMNPPRALAPEDQARENRYLMQEVALALSLAHVLNQQEDPATRGTQTTLTITRENSTVALTAILQDVATARNETQNMSEQELNTQDEAGRTRLIRAAREGSWAVTRLLLQSRANPHIRDHEGRRAFEQAGADLLTEGGEHPSRAFNNLTQRVQRLIQISLNGQESMVNARGEITAIERQNPPSNNQQNQETQ